MATKINYYPKPMADVRYIRVIEAAEHRGVTRQAISKLVRKGRIRHKWIEGKLLVLRSDVINFVKRSPPGRPRNGQHKRT